MSPGLPSPPGLYLGGSIRGSRTQACTQHASLSPKGVLCPDRLRGHSLWPFSGRTHTQPLGELMGDGNQPFSASWTRHNAGHSVCIFSDSHPSFTALLPPQVQMHTRAEKTKCLLQGYEVAENPGLSYSEVYVLSLFPISYICVFKTSHFGTSLVAQWLGIHLTMQGTRVRTLVREDPTGCGATKPMSHNC